ncbi:MAG: adenylate/guanylate cyclase domain-containing protein [Verrucomicrobiota bacterium]
MKTKVDDLLRTIQSPSTSIHELRDIWESRSLAIWLNHPELHAALTLRLQHRSHPFWVFEITDEGKQCEACNDEIFTQLTRTAALSLARTGATRSAMEMLNKLLEKGSPQAETFCLLGRLQKDVAYTAKAGEKRKQHLQSAFSYYSRAVELEPYNYYPLINTATVALLLGNKNEASIVAEQVIALCQKQIEENDDYWLLATLAEAQLLLGNTDKAGAHYRAAAEKVGHEYSSLQSMRSQARQILNAQDQDPSLLDSTFLMPRVVVFSGHRIDAAERSKPRFPPSAIAAVSRNISTAVANWTPMIAYASAAPGGDLIFCEAVLKNGNELRLVLPFDLKNFRGYILQSADADWLQRFDWVAARATSIVTASSGKHHEQIQGSAIYDFVNRLILGLARFESRFLETSLQTIALWDQVGLTVTGGTADCIALWQSVGLTVDTIIDPSGAPLLPVHQSPDLIKLDRSSLQNKNEQQIKAILFADIVGYSKLEDYDLPRYYDSFLKPIAESIARFDFAPLTSNCWGDAFYFVFDSVREAGLFALEFHRAIEQQEWLPQSTGKKLHFRIALNAGPVFELRDPVTGTLNFTGQHTNRAARIEPMVQEGQIYVSEYFAALASVEQIDEFALDYVGYRPLPKKYGSSRVFILRAPQ